MAISNGFLISISAAGQKLSIDLTFLIGQATGFFLGLSASLITWWFLTHYLTPKIEFGSFVSKAPYGPNKEFNGNRVKIRNARQRPIHDVRIYAMVTVYGAVPGKPKNTLSFRIALNLLGEEEYVTPVLKVTGNRVLRLMFEKTRSIDASSYIPIAIKDAMRTGNGDLVDLLKITDSPKNHLKLYVSGSDSLSGSRKVFQSQAYYYSSVMKGTFRGLDRNPSHPVLADAPA